MENKRFLECCCTDAAEAVDAMMGGAGRVELCEDLPCGGVSPADCPAEVVEKERELAVQKTKDEMVQKAVEAALKKVGINPAHVDSEDHIESNTAKGWITPEQAEQAREIIKTVSAEKAASLPEQMIQNIANGRIQKFFKEQTLEEQDFVQSDEKVSVAAYIKSVDKDAKVVAFKRFSLSD